MTPPAELSLAGGMARELTLADPAANLALDEAILLDAESELSAAKPRLRFWESPDTFVVLGASGRIRGEVHVEIATQEGVPILRRASGGGTVVIAPGALNVAVVLPTNAAPQLAAVDSAQEFVLERIAAGLRGIDPRIRTKGAGDLTIDTKKFAGSAQRRLKRCVLIHVSILLAGFDLVRVSRLLPMPGRRPDYRGERSHEDFLTTLAAGGEEVREAIVAAWFGDRGPRPPAWDYPQELVDRLVAEKYGCREWIERM